MAFFEALRRAIRDYAEGVHQAGEPLGQGGEHALEARLRRALPPSYAELLRSFDGLMLFNEQLQLFGSADAGLCFLIDGSLRIGEGPEGALLLGADGAVRLCDEEQPDPIIAGTDLERFLDATLARLLDQRQVLLKHRLLNLRDGTRLIV